MRFSTSVRYVLSRSLHRRRLTALSVASLLCLSGALPAAADSSQDQLQQLRAQEAGQKSQLDQLARQQRDAAAALNQLKTNLDAVNADLSAAYQQLQGLQGQVKQIQDRENALQERHDRRVRDFLDATRATYKKGTGEWVVYLFNSDSFSAFLDRLAYVTAIARNDVAEADRLRKEREAIGRERKKTEELAAELQPILAQITARLTGVAGTYHSQALVESQIEQQQRAQLVALLGTQHREKELEAALAASQAAAEAAAQKGGGRAYGSVCPAAPAGMVSFCGHGFGHGVGLGQYGALGMAQAGIGWQRIVTTFYSGTALGPVSDQTVRVHLHAAGSTITPRFSGAAIEDQAGSVLAHVGADAGVTFSRKPDGTVTCSACGGRSAGQLRLVPDPGAVFQVTGSGARYRGEAWLDGSSGLTLINHVSVESYLQGLAEVPSSWPLNAIAAQIVAARTYALYHLGGGLYDVEDTTASQVYGGYDREAPQQNAAVAATRGQAVLYQGQLIDAVFSSSDGGHTECSSAVWGKGNDNPCDYPYLSGVIDNYDVSPLHTWYTPPHRMSEIQGYLMAGGIYDAGKCGVLDHFSFSRDRSDRVRQVQMVGDKGSCSAGSTDFMNGLNKGSPTDFVIYGEMFGVTPGQRAWPYF